MGLTFRSSRPQLEPGDHTAWRELIRERCGLDFGDTRGSYLSRCLWERMQAQGITGYGEYYRRVALGPAGRREWRALLELLVNRETSFFRHPASYEGLSRVLPELLAARARQGISSRCLWSAGCSTGQEVYSMAMCVLEGIARVGGRWQVRVTGSDISELALEAARCGRFTARQITTLSEPYRRRYLTPVQEERRVFYEVKDCLRSITQFGSWNLIEPETYHLTAQDVIFCQNLLVYQRPEDRGELVGRFCRRLNPGGYLFLAPGEVVGLKLPEVQPARLASCLTYRRTD